MYLRTLYCILYHENTVQYHTPQSKGVVGVSCDDASRCAPVFKMCLQTYPYICFTALCFVLAVIATTSWMST